MPLTAQFIRNLRRFRLVTFDITDTLLKFSRPPGLEYAETAALFGYPNIDANKLSQSFRAFFKSMCIEYPNYGKNEPNMGWYQWWIQLVINVFDSVNPNMPKDDLLKIAKYLVDIYRTEKCWMHIDGSREIVAKIKESGKTLGVISNFDGSLDRILTAMDMKVFDIKVVAYDCGIIKPDRRIFDLALKKCNVTCDQALHIGNMYEYDYVGAIKAGWTSILISQMNDDELLCKGICKKYVYPDLVKLVYALEHKELRL